MAAEDLGFLPNRLGHRGWRGGSALASVGLVMGDLGNPFWSSVARGVERELARADLLLITGEPRGGCRLQRRLLRRSWNGGSTGSSSCPHPATTTSRRCCGASRRGDRPPARAPLLDEVLFDDRGGASDRRRRPRRSRSRRIAFVGAETGLWTVQERLAGYRQALAAAGIDVDPRLVRLDCSSRHGGVRDA
jgi:LacI family transcriptional regulator